VLSGSTGLDDATVASLHHEAHTHCWIANSIRGEVRIAGGWRRA
jgi:organic hydroperoxide reductase OsmC/OhrA